MNRMKNNIEAYTQGQIRILSPYLIQSVSELQITEAINDHGKLYAKCLLKDYREDNPVLVGSNNAVSVLGVSDKEETLLFSGVITETNVINENNVFFVEICGESWSSVLDYEIKSRAFQDESMSYSDISRLVLSDYDHGTSVSVDGRFDKASGHFVLQYQETDWDFLKRLASHYNTVLVADSMGTGVRLWLGIPQKRAELRDIEEVRTIRDEGCYIAAVSAGLPVYESSYVKYEVKSKCPLALCDKVEYDGKTLVVENSRAYLEKGVLCYTYLLGIEASLCVPRKSNERIQGLSLLGNIVSTENQRVKIALNIDEKRVSNSSCSFPYASQANNLFYCMPETGTSVSLYFSEGDERKGIAMNAVRRNGGNCSKTSDPKIKYMGTPEGKELKLGVTDISFTAHEQLFMMLDANKGLSVQSNENLNIFSKQKLQLEAKELIKIFAKTGNIIVGAKEESTLFLLGGPDGDAHIKAGSNVIYSGRKHEVFTDRLNSEIAYEEKKFDWGKLICNVLIGLAIVACVAAAVFTGGASLVAAGAIAATTASAAVTGAIVSGVIAVGVLAATDIARGEVSDWQDYALAGFKGALEGAISGAILGTAAFKGAKLIVQMLVSGVVSFGTDAISQGIEILFYGGEYDWKRGLISFGIGFVMPAIAKGIEKGVNKLMDKMGKKMSDAYRKALCELFGDPVDVISGNVYSEAIDFELPGPFPLQWVRCWGSVSRIVGHLGHGGRYNYEMGLDVYEDEHAIIVYLNDGRACAIPQLLIGEEYFDYKNSFLIRRLEDGYQLFDPDSQYTYTMLPSENGYMKYKLTRVEDLVGHGISFFYNSLGYLCSIIDSVGRNLDVETNSDGRITNVSLLENKAKNLLVGYSYNHENDLCGVTDALGKTTNFFYRNHLMVKKTNRDKNSFYWEYDKYEDGARAVRSWGDGGMLNVSIEFHDDEMFNVVRYGKSENYREFHYDERKLCVKKVFADHTQIQEKYNDRYQLVSRIDEEGRPTSFQYNDMNQLIGVTLPDASKITLSYDEKGRLVEKSGADGEGNTWVYNEDNTLQKTKEATGVESLFEYDQKRLLKAIKNEKGEKVRFSYDDHANLSRVELPNGTVSEWEYDFRGNCTRHKTALGAEEKYYYDALNRLVHAKLADGNVVTLEYNSYEDITRIKDQSRDIVMEYNILGTLNTRIEGSHRYQYKYDNDNQLVSIVNEKGELYKLERDKKGNIVKEIGFDKTIRSFERDLTGLVTKIKRPGGRYTKFTYDKRGRLIRSDYHDDSFEEYTYGKNGWLDEVKNQYVTVKFERDQFGRVVKEWQNENWVEKQYEQEEKQVELTSCFGANILSKYDIAGQTTHMVAHMNGKNSWAARLEYNALGQEVMQQVSGGVVSSLTYDVTGRPVDHSVHGKRGNTLRHRRYEWDVNARLKKMTNELSKGTIVYSYDSFQNLAAAQGDEILSVFRSFDEVGNLYATKDRSDRVFGEGGRLETARIDLKEKLSTYQGGYGRLVTSGVEYYYDEEGNLALKKNFDGSTWEYYYYGNGMLRKVIRPDKSEVIFKYDGLGRRVEKCIVRPSGKPIHAISNSKPEMTMKWQRIGGVSVCKDEPTLNRDHVIKRNVVSIFTEDAEESQNKKTQERIVKFLWSGKSLLHEWEEKQNTYKTRRRVEFQADYLSKMEEEKSRREVELYGEKGKLPETLVTWVFKDDFVPIGKMTKDGNYGIVTDYLGTPVEAYDDDGNLVWKKELDINGKVQTGSSKRYGTGIDDVGEQSFIPFRFQGQYEDVETGLYYNLLRYYDPAIGQYTQKDPIGMAGNNPTLYAYVPNPLEQVDPYGLTWKDLLATGLGHHLFPRSVANKLGYDSWAKLIAPAWYPNNTAGSGELHQQLHTLLRDAGIPFHGSKFTGTIDDFFEMAAKAYGGIDDLGYLKIPGTTDKILKNVTPAQALEEIKKMIDEGTIPTPCGK